MTMYRQSVLFHQVLTTFCHSPFVTMHTKYNWRRTKNYSAIDQSLATKNTSTYFLTVFDPPPPYFEIKLKKRFFHVSSRFYDTGAALREYFNMFWYFTAISHRVVVVPSPKIAINLPGPIRSFPVKENHIDSVVSKILRYRETSFYFILRTIGQVRKHFYDVRIF